MKGLSFKGRVGQTWAGGDVEAPGTGRPFGDRACTEILEDQTGQRLRPKKPGPKSPGRKLVWGPPELRDIRENR